MKADMTYLIQNRGIVNVLDHASKAYHLVALHEIPMQSTKSKPTPSAQQHTPATLKFKPLSNMEQYKNTNQAGRFYKTHYSVNLKSKQASSSTYVFHTYLPFFEITIMQARLTRTATIHNTSPTTISTTLGVVQNLHKITNSQKL